MLEKLLKSPVMDILTAFIIVLLFKDLVISYISHPLLAYLVLMLLGWGGISIKRWLLGQAI